MFTRLSQQAHAVFHPGRHTLKSFLRRAEHFHPFSVALCVLMRQLDSLQKTHNSLHALAGNRRQCAAISIQTCLPVCVIRVNSSLDEISTRSHAQTPLSKTSIDVHIVLGTHCWEKNCWRTVHEENVLALDLVSDWVEFNEEEAFFNKSTTNANENQDALLVCEVKLWH